MPETDPSLDFTLRWLPAEPFDAVERLSEAGADVYPLERRGVAHGFVARGRRAPTATPDPQASWSAAEAVLLPDLVDTARHAADLERSRAMFDRLRGGARFLDEVDARLSDDAELRYAGSTVDKLDAREIEKVFVDVLREERGEQRRYSARDLWAKLSWVADDERDESLRIRFSFGHEATRDWLGEPARMAWSDRLAERMFPECAAVGAAAALHDLLATLLGVRHRLTERIVYDFVPGGGARFHHDADPGQLGVLFVQLTGHTAWLATPRAELAGLVAELAEGGLRRRVEQRGAGVLDDDADAELSALLDADPRLTRALAEKGRLLLLGPGDALLLPSHDVARVAWHSVFGTGDEIALGLSHGLFPATAVSAS